MEPLLWVEELWCVSREEEELLRSQPSMVVISAMERLKKKGSASQLSVWDLLALRVPLAAMDCRVEMVPLAVLELLVLLEHQVSQARMAILEYQAGMAMMVCQVLLGLKARMD